MAGRISRKKLLFRYAIILIIIFIMIIMLNIFITIIFKNEIFILKNPCNYLSPRNIGSISEDRFSFYGLS